MVSEVTTTFIHDKRRTLKNGKFPVKLRVTHERKSRLYNLANISLDESEFQKVSGNRVSSDLKSIRSEIFNEILNVETIIKKVKESNPPFTFEKFDNLYKLKKEIRTVEDVFQLVIDAKHNANKIGTASSYNDAHQALKRYRNTKALLFSDITKKFLDNYESHLTEVELKSINTVGVYMRSLKVIYNRAVDLNVVARELYPFATRATGVGYHIPKESTRKRSLTKEDIQKLYYEYQPIEGSPEWKAKSYFMFSYLCNGMNFADLAELKKTDYDREWIKYYRKKTKSTANEKKLIQIHVSEPVKRLVNDLKDPTKSSVYLFPILSDKMNEVQKREERQQFIKTTNKWLKRIAKELSLSIEDISTYYARHSWATIQKRNGTSIELISDSLGHHTLKMTQIYLDSFDEETLKGLNDDII